MGAGNLTIPGGNRNLSLAACHGVSPGSLTKSTLLPYISGSPWEQM